MFTRHRIRRRAIGRGLFVLRRRIFRRGRSISSTGMGYFGLRRDDRDEEENDAEKERRKN